MMIAATDMTVVAMTIDLPEEALMTDPHPLVSMIPIWTGGLLTHQEIIMVMAVMVHTEVVVLEDLHQGTRILL